MIRRHTVLVVVRPLVHVLWVLCTCVAFCATTPAGAADDVSTDARDARTVALLPLLGSGLALDELTTADAAIQREVDARWGDRSLPASIVRERLEEGAKRGLRCDRSLESCQAQLGIVCDTDLVVIAALAPTTTAAAAATTGFTLSLRIVDVAEAAQLAFASATYPGLPTRDDVKRLIEKLDKPEARKAILVVTGPSGAPVVVDGAARGSLPLPQPIELPSGRHEVVVHTEPQYTTTVTMRRGERVEVRAPAAPVAAANDGNDGPGDGADRNAALGGDAPTEGGPPARVLAIAGGGALTVLGGTALVVGLGAWLNYADAASQLEAHEAATVQDRGYLARADDDIRASYTQYEEGERDWNDWGQLAVLGGSAALVVGAAVVVVGVVALE